MQLKRTLFTFLSVLVILIFSWFLLLFSQGLLEENSNENVNYIPKEATYALRLDGRELAEETLFSVFLDSRDDLVLKLIEQRVSKGLSGEGQLKNYGIDFLSDVVLFELPFEGHTVAGLLVNVTNGRLFERKLAKKNKVYAYNDHVGLILTPLFSKEVNMSKLKDYAQKIIDNPESGSFTNFKKDESAGTFFEMYSQNDPLNADSPFKQSNLIFELHQKQLFVHGDAEMKSGKKEIPTINSDFDSKGLHLSSSIIPSSLNDSINSWLKQFEVKKFEIEQVSLNYFGSKVINHSSGFFVVPQMDLLINTNENFSISDFFKNEELKNYLDYTLGDDFIQFQDEKLYFKQISKKSFYLGINHNPVISKNQAPIYFHVKGNLTPLTEIKGGGLMTTFLEMLPIYQATKSLADGTEELNFSIKKTSNNKAKIEGNIIFHEDKRPLNEVMKFLLLGEFF